MDVRTERDYGDGFTAGELADSQQLVRGIFFVIALKSKAAPQPPPPPPTPPRPSGFQHQRPTVVPSTLQYLEYKRRQAVHKHVQKEPSQLQPRALHTEAPTAVPKLILNKIINYVKHLKKALTKIKKKSPSVSQKPP